jgi:predicted DNA-binding ribbon-helix-helix protein
VEQAMLDALIARLADRSRERPTVANLLALLRVLRPESYR